MGIECKELCAWWDRVSLVNGVFRSGTYGDSGLRCRSGGLRWNSSKRTYVHYGVGFL